MFIDHKHSYELIKIHKSYKVESGIKSKQEENIIILAFGDLQKGGETVTEKEIIRLLRIYSSLLLTFAHR